MFGKQHLWMGISIILFLALVLSACGPVNPPSASRANPTLAVTQEAANASGTATPAESPTGPSDVPQSQQAYTNQDFGFSLYYPEGYEVQSSVYHTIIFLAPQGTPGHRERAFLTVELTFDQDAGWYASRMKEDNLNLGTDISSSVNDIGGQQAYILGRLPGQDLNRQVFIVVRGILYHLTFVPDDSQAGEAYQQMETLYTAIIDSLRFLPERREVPPVTELNNMIHQLERALEARSQDDILRPLGDEFFLGYWMPETPEGVTYENYGRNEAVPLIMDKYLSQLPDLTLEDQVDWASLVGSPDLFSSYFPNEVVTPVLVKGWGPQATDEAVMIIARRSDGSLYWRGMFVAQGTFSNSGY